MTEKPFQLGQYVRKGYRAWFNLNGGPVGDKKTIDQLEADYRASLTPAPYTGPRPPFVAHGVHHSTPTLRSERRPKRRESETRNNG